MCPSSFSKEKLRWTKDVSARDIESPKVIQVNTFLIYYSVLFVEKHYERRLKMDKKYYDLTAAQKILFVSQKYTIYKQVNNICTSVLMDKELDYNIMKQAVDIAYKRNDAFRIRVVEVDKEAKQYFAEHEEPYLSYLSFTGISDEDMDKKLHKLAKKKVSNFGKQMSRIYFLRSNDNRCGLFFVVSHFIMDSWAITTFYKDVFAVYEAIKNSTEMPKPLYPYEKLLKEELHYKKTAHYLKDLAFWEEELDASEPIYTHVNGAIELEKYRKKKNDDSLRYGPFFTFFSNANNTMLPFPKDLVDKMEEYCTENKITMQSVVLLALRSYLAKVNNVDDVSMYTIVARRGKLKEKNTGGSRVHYFPLRTIFSEEDDFKSSSEFIRNKLSSIFKHANINPREVAQITNEKFDVPQLGTYFIGMMTFQPVKLQLTDGTRIETKWYGNGAIATPFYLTVMDGDASGGLKFYYEYHKNRVNEDTIKKLHEFMIDYIEEGIKE